MNPNLTAAQKDALTKAWQLLCEHFDYAIVAYETSIEKADQCVSTFDCNYHGGISPALGLIERAKNEWLNTDDSPDDEEDWKKESLT